MPLHLFDRDDLIRCDVDERLRPARRPQHLLPIGARGGAAAEMGAQPGRA